MSYLEMVLTRETERTEDRHNRCQLEYFSNKPMPQKEIYLFEKINQEQSFEINKLENDYLREEELEIRRARRDIFNENFPKNREDYISVTKSSVPKGEYYFEESALTIVGLDGGFYQPYISKLKSALMQFQKGFIDEQFAVDYFSSWLKQGWKLVRKPSNIFERIYKKLNIDSEHQEEITEEELKRYNLQLDVQLENSHFGQHFSEKYFDTPFNFCLTYDGKLIALVGFVPQNKGIRIEQVQGIRGNHKKLTPFKWERALVNYVIEWAKQYRIENVSMISADNNKWAHREGHLDLEQGRMLYDVNAKRNGFKKGDDGNYHKDLKQKKDNILQYKIF